jgi:hypothetical protein
MGYGPQPQIPNPQSPIPNPHAIIINYLRNSFNSKIFLKIELIKIY